MNKSDKNSILLLFLHGVSHTIMCKTSLGGMAWYVGNGLFVVEWIWFVVEWIVRRGMDLVRRGAACCARWRHNAHLASDRG